MQRELFRERRGSEEQRDTRGHSKVERRFFALSRGVIRSLNDFSLILLVIIEVLFASCLAQEEM